MINYITTLAIPAIIITIITAGIINKNNIFELFSQGVKEALKTSIQIFPTLLGIFFMINIFMKSGIIEDICKLLEGPFEKIKFPKEILPLAIFRPISGSGAMGIMKNIIEENGPDSYIGKIAATIVGSTETTIYTIILYTNSVKMRVDKKILYIGLTADLVAILISIIIWKIKNF